MHKKLTKNERQMRKKYLAMVKKHQRNLDELNKAAHRSPWDSCFMLNYMAEFMEFMQDYYNQTWNLMQSEESLINVQNTLKETIDAYYDWQTFEDKFFHYEERTKLIIEYKEKCIKDMCSWNSEDLQKYIEENIGYKDFSSERLEEFNKIYKEKRTKFFQLLADHFEEWWD